MPTYIYHITAIENLPSIVECGGLRCLKAMCIDGTRYANIAYDTVQDRRATTRVPCGPRGVLHDYVPFYFGPRSPMLYAIHNGRVQCTNGQAGVAYLVSTVEAVEDAGIDYVFTDGHGIMAMSRFFTDLDRLDQIDWPLMRTKYWADTNSDMDRKRRRQAEFLAHQFFPWGLVHFIAVMRQSLVSTVRRLIGDSDGTFDVRAIPKYYY